MNKELLRQAAQAVLDRWNSPMWDWHKHGPTADLMHALRAAIAQPEFESWYSTYMWTAAADITPRQISRESYAAGFEAAIAQPASPTLPPKDEESAAIAAYESTGGNTWNYQSRKTQDYWRTVASAALNNWPKNQLGAE